MEEEQEEIEEQSLSIDYSGPLFPIYKRVLKYYLPPRVTVWMKYDMTCKVLKTVFDLLRYCYFYVNLYFYS